MPTKKLENTVLLNRIHLILLALIVVASFLFNFVNNDFPEYYHPDEDIKGKYIKKGGTSFRHPVLMLLVNQFANFFTGHQNLQEIVEQGRTISAIFGALIVLASYLFSRRLLKRWWALLVAFATGVVPIIVVHAHYLKEDITLTAFTTGSIVAFFHCVQKRSLGSAIFLGIISGLAFSAKYVALLLIIIYLLAPLLCGIQKKGRVYKHIFQALGISLIVFLIVNFYLFANSDVFVKGVSFETNHMLKGHSGIEVSPITQLFSYHLKESVIPGMTWPLAVLALAYMLNIVLSWRRIRWEEKFLFIFVLVFYITIESTPSKPEPDFMRYAIPLIPVLCFFAFRTVIEVVEFAVKSRRVMLTNLVFACFLAYPIYDSVNLVAHLTDDTRAQLKAFLDEQPRGTVQGEKYTKSKYEVRYLWKFYKKDLPKKTKYVVASNFAYDRYFKAHNYPGVKDRIVKRWRFYKKLFENKAIEFKPKYRSYAFTNPTIKIFSIKDLKESGAFEELGMEY